MSSIVSYKEWFLTPCKKVYKRLAIEKPCTYSFEYMDEMKIKNGLVFNKHTGSLTCFVDLGSANKDISKGFLEILKNLWSRN